MAGERFVGLCRLDAGLVKAERLVSQEGLQPVG
jgi:tRNA pseudouridine55 synthase